MSDQYGDTATTAWHDRRSLADHDECQYVDHYAAGDLDVSCDLPRGHAGDHHIIPAPTVDDHEDEPRESLSSNHFSTDQQLADVVVAMPDNVRATFLAEFPEWDSLSWTQYGTWILTQPDDDAPDDAPEPEYSSWAIDWIESHTNVMWEDGEPWIYGGTVVALTK